MQGLDNLLSRYKVEPGTKCYRVVDVLSDADLKNIVENIIQSDSLSEVQLEQFFGKEERIY